MASSLTLFVPGLLQRISERDAPECPALPTLERVLSCARSEAFAATGKDSCLLRLLLPQAPEPLAMAALGWLADSDDDSPAAGDGGWLRADPVHLHTDRDRLLLFDARHLDISEAEKEAISATLREHFGPVGLALHAPRRTRWYLHQDRIPELRTTPLDQVTGRDLLRYLPEGEDSGHWRQLLNEVQMLLYQHPVNQQREQRGQPTINSLWFWGNGALPAAPSRCFHQVFSDDPVSHGAALLSSTPCASVPDSAGEWLRSDIDDGDQLIQLDAIHQAHTLGSVPAWSDALHQFEQHWLEALLEALTNRRLEQILLIAADGHQYRITRHAMGRWWRRSQAFSSFLQPAPDAPQ